MRVEYHITNQNDYDDCKDIHFPEVDAQCQRTGLRTWVLTLHSHGENYHSAMLIERAEQLLPLALRKEIPIYDEKSLYIGHRLYPLFGRIEQRLREVIFLLNYESGGELLSEKNQELNNWGLNTLLQNLFNWKAYVVREDSAGFRHYNIRYKNEGGLQGATTATIADRLPTEYIQPLEQRQQEFRHKRNDTMHFRTLSISSLQPTLNRLDEYAGKTDELVSAMPKIFASSDGFNQSLTFLNSLVAEIPSIITFPTTPVAFPRFSEIVNTVSKNNQNILSNIPAICNIYQGIANNFSKSIERTIKTCSLAIFAPASETMEQTISIMTKPIKTEISKPVQQLAQIGNLSASIVRAQVETMANNELAALRESITKIPRPETAIPLEMTARAISKQSQPRNSAKNEKTPRDIEAADSTNDAMRTNNN
ncbi:hypothetical protein BPORC_0645 [Bifidobacterium porcinum]|nr:hypothetical protein BPORC_0645 [Bifidobacterium porcinum]